jgi:hypothetical protein
VINNLAAGDPQRLTAEGKAVQELLAAHRTALLLWVPFYKVIHCDHIFFSVAVHSTSINPVEMSMGNGCGYEYKYTSFTLNLTNSCSWSLNVRALGYNINLLCRFLPGFIVDYWLFFFWKFVANNVTFCTIEPKSRYFLSLYPTHQSSLLTKLVRNTNRQITDVESTGAI